MAKDKRQKRILNAQHYALRIRHVVWRRAPQLKADDEKKRGKASGRETKVQK